MVAECTCGGDIDSSRLRCTARPEILSCYVPSAHETSTGNISHCNELRHTPLWIRHKEIEELEEDCLPVLDSFGSASSRASVGKRLEFSEGEDFTAIFNEFCEAAFENRDDIWAGRNLEFVVGQSGLAAIYRITHASRVSTPQDNATSEHMAAVLDPEVIDPEKLFDYVYTRSNASWLQNLQACAAVTKIYSYLPHATISSLVFSQPLAEGSWCQNLKIRKTDLIESPFRLSLPEVFSCIALFDSGIYNVPVDNLCHVFAMSTGNSIFVTSALLEDPHREPNLSDVRRVPGNIGQSGISFLVGPEIPKTRAIDMNNWRLVNHAAFEGSLEDNFHQSSIHMSFTGYNMPLKTERRNRHIIDRPARLVEALVSVHDKGLWVADLNLVETLTFTEMNESGVDWRGREDSFNIDTYGDDSSDEGQDEGEAKNDSGHVKLDFIIPGLHRLVCNCLLSDRAVCESNSFLAMSAKLQEMEIAERLSTFTSIDNWDELLDFPQTSVLVVRTHKNWLARLAVTAETSNDEN
ncbi:hypothetical protein IFR05_000291 [Cadophora sp. M221]|nr:hypothetical protein IFR05_000291 [Cadophora sp. M221]